MIIGTLKEIKVAENRVSMTAAGVETMVQHGHRVLVEKNAGIGSGFADESYLQAGAIIVDAPAEVYRQADIAMHVKEPQPSEYEMIRPDQIVFTYLHLAADEAMPRALLETGSVGIAYETIQKPDGALPLLTPDE
jgi:alanine dehydrogenase